MRRLACRRAGGRPDPAVGGGCYELSHFCGARARGLLSVPTPIRGFCPELRRPTGSAACDNLDSQQLPVVNFDTRRTFFGRHAHAPSTEPEESDGPLKISEYKYWVDMHRVRYGRVLSRVIEACIMLLAFGLFQSTHASEKYYYTGNPFGQAACTLGNFISNFTCISGNVTSVVTYKSSTDFSFSLYGGKITLNSTNVTPNVGNYFNVSESGVVQS